MPSFALARTVAGRFTTGAIARHQRTRAHVPHGDELCPQCLGCCHPGRRGAPALPGLVDVWEPVGMGLLSLRLRCAVRGRWLAQLGSVALLGLLGGLSMFAFAGARRTQSAYPRFLRAANVSTMAIDNGAYDAKRDAEVAAFPEVVSSRTYMAPFGGLIGPDGKPDLNVNAEILASVDGRYFDQFDGPQPRQVCPTPPHSPRPPARSTPQSPCPGSCPNCRASLES